MSGRWSTNARRPGGRKREERGVWPVSPRKIGVGEPDRICSKRNKGFRSTFERLGKKKREIHQTLNCQLIGWESNPRT